MFSATPNNRLAVCSWSLQPASARDLLTQLRETEISRVQLALDPLIESPDHWRNVQELLGSEHITIVSGMVGCLAEDYTTLESIRRTGGIAPDATWEQNLKHFHAAAGVARDLGLELVTFHAGFVPHDTADPQFARMRDRLRETARIFAAHGIQLGLETGQETAADLALLLESLDCPDVGVNFDPANMILYDKGDPVASVRLLARWVRQVHVKDAKRTRTPGTWGEEVPVGSGEVDWPGFFAALKDINYTGHFVIERESGTQRVADIRTAAGVCRRLNP